MSVVVATRDRPEPLTRCLRALIAQDVRPREIVVVDQGTEPLDAEILAGLDRVVVLRDEGIGLSRARNVALKAARSRFVAVLDDDCVPATGWLAAIHSELTRDRGVDGVCGPVLPLPPHGKRVFSVSSRTSAMPVDYEGAAVPWHVGTGGNFAARTELVRNLGGYDCRLGAGSPSGAGEDIDLIYRMLRVGAKIRYSPKALVRHERVSASTRRATRRSYGRGIGAFIGVHGRRGEIRVTVLLLRWALQRLALLTRSAVRLNRVGVIEEVIVLASTVGGLTHGLQMDPKGGR